MGAETLVEHEAGVSDRYPLLMRFVQLRQETHRERSARRREGHLVSWGRNEEEAWDGRAFTRSLARLIDVRPFRT